MNATEIVWACIGAAVGLALVATYGWDAWHRRYGPFQTAARQAARAPRTEAEVRRELDLTECLAIWNTTPTSIPTQRQHRTEDPQ